MAVEREGREGSDGRLSESSNVGFCLRKRHGVVQGIESVRNATGESLQIPEANAVARPDHVPRPPVTVPATEPNRSVSVPVGESLEQGVEPIRIRVTNLIGRGKDLAEPGALGERRRRLLPSGMLRRKCVWVI